MITLFNSEFPVNTGFGIGFDKEFFVFDFKKNPVYYYDARAYKALNENGFFCFVSPSVFMALGYEYLYDICCFLNSYKKAAFTPSLYGERNHIVFLYNKSMESFIANATTKEKYAANIFKPSKTKEFADGLRNFINCFLKCE